jgi:hypothetical protein
VSVLKSYHELNPEQKLAYQMGYAAAEEIAARDQGDALVILSDMIDRGMEALDPIDRDNLHRDGVRRILMAALSDRSDKPNPFDYLDDAERPWPQ